MVVASRASDKFGGLVPQKRSNQLAWLVSNPVYFGYMMIGTKLFIRPKKKLFVSDFRPALLKQVRPEFILWIFKKKKKVKG